MTVSEDSAPPSSNDGPISVVLDRARFARFADLVTDTLGIKMPAAKVTLLENRLRGRMRQLGITSIDAYEQYLFRSAHSHDELVHFCDVVTTNKTDFFREPQHFDFLREHVLPSLAGERQSGELRLWCAGCSSGQEAYTLAMVASEFAEQEGRRFSILATDISTRMLAQARRAIYPENIALPIPLELRKKYLLRSKDRRQALVRVRPELRRAVAFERLNFMDRDYRRRGSYDAIFFRNVMIYFDKATQEAVVNRLAQSLTAGGYLFIGLSESLVGARVPLTTVGPAILRKT